MVLKNPLGITAHAKLLRGERGEGEWGKEKERREGAAHTNHSCQNRKVRETLHSAKNRTAFPFFHNCKENRPDTQNAHSPHISHAAYVRLGGKFPHNTL